MPPTMLAPPALKKMIEIPSTPPGRDVSIIHPAVGKSFLELPSCPTLSGDYGVQLGLILEACCIIAQNKAGRLTTDQEGQDPISSQDLELWLPPGKYYYHLQDKLPGFFYPLCFDFNAWKPEDPPQRWIDALPHERLAVVGMCSDASATTKQMDESCLLTGFTVGLNASHLIPRANGLWFMFHDLRETIVGPTKCLEFDSPVNMITLLSVLNGDGLNQSYFTFVPMSGKYVAYSLREEPQFIATLHTQEVDFPERIPAKFVYCRFAWNIINRARDTTRMTATFFDKVSVPAGLRTKIDQSKSKKRKVDHAENGDEEDQAIPGEGGAGEGEGEMNEDGSIQSGSSFPSLSRYAGVIPPSQWTLDALKESQKYDERLKKAYGDQTIEDAGIYPGFSDIQAVAFKYVSENCAATDPGGARLATLAEILAGDE